ncbi:ligand-binding sensor domain-containing diguanylate cyclase [Edaphobacter flagellatus]|uniref:ligand-binding sensor domain-containing diguanylate cyclase n=1 Tax=Edaphobacter flagellatus TaxID=1933044 RepID=UPI0021B41728|nr:diguanylate cyclase [Edaphobacter flagellatus]
MSSTPTSRYRHAFSRRTPLFAACLAAFLFLTRFTAAQQFTFAHYGQDEGLRNLDVFSVVEDNSGLLWLATENGLFRYDGSGFQRFGPEDGLGEPLVLGLYKDPAGRIWVNTNDHFYYVENSRLIDVPFSDQPAQLGPGQRIASLDADHLLFLARGSLRLIEHSGTHWTSRAFVDTAQLAAHPDLAHLHNVFVAPDRSLWLGCGDAICHLSDAANPAHAHVEIFAEPQGIAAGLWLRFFADSHGNLWARSLDHTAILPAHSNTFHLRDLPGDLAAYHRSGILTFAEDPAGRILTQAGNGIARWEGSAWRILDHDNGLAFKDVSTILFDRHGSPWFSTRGHGVFRWLGYDQVENWTTAQGLHDDIAWLIFRDHQGRLWVDDQLQASRLDDATHRLVTPPVFERTPVLHGSGMQQSTDGALWAFLITGEVQRYDPSIDRVTFRGKVSGLLRTFTDSAGRIWIAGNDGLYVIRTPNAPAIEKISDPLVSSDGFADIAESPNHDLWFLSDQHLYRLSHTDNRYTEIALDHTATRGQMRNLAIAPDSTLWIGGGIPALLHLRIEGNNAKTLDSVTAPDIVSGDVQIVRFDQRGWLWIGTDLGINVFDGKQWRLLTQRDGLVSNDTNEGAFFADRDGSVWIGANGGAMHILHPEQIFDTSPLDLRITSASLGGSQLALTSNTLARWHDAPLDLRFTSLNFHRNGALRFRYRLTGLESSWNETTLHALHYAALPPGDYRFELQAVDLDRQLRSAITSFSFTVSPPWWRTPPFYFVLAVLTFIASILVWHLRERRLIQRQRILRQLVAQRTRELEAEKAELLTAREALRQQATRDALTGLWNRPAIIDILIREMDSAHRSGASLAIVLADVDHFKQINDTYGHLTGDAILRDAAERMEENIRPSDYLGRYGGEEFLLVLPGLPYEDPHTRLNQLQQAIAGKPFTCEGRSIQVTSSFGVAWLEPTIATIEDLIRRADEALYQAKAQGRDCIVFYNEPCEEPQDQYKA